MKIAKDGIRSIVKVGYDGRVHKTFRGTDREERFANEVRILKVLEARGCEFVPRFLDADEETLTLITTNCGKPAEGSIGEAKAKALFDQLETEFGVTHDDQHPRNITYNEWEGRFMVIDFELGTVGPDPTNEHPEEEIHRALTWSGASREGTRKKKNQDALSVFTSEEGWAYDAGLQGSESIDEDGVIFAVSDGMGGPAAGDVASELVVRELRRFLPSMMGDFHGVSDPHQLLESAVVSLHEYVTKVGERKDALRGMGATVVCGLFHRAHVYFAHVGDSRMYRWREGALTQLTHDHSYVGTQFREGKLNEREARNHPRRSMLRQAIGGGCQYVEPQVDSSFLEAGDWYLICSDGITDGLWDKHIAGAFEDAARNGKSVDEVQEALLEKAFREAGQDDTTLIVVRVE